MRCGWGFVGVFQDLLKILQREKKEGGGDDPIMDTK